MCRPILAFLCAGLGISAAWAEVKTLSDAPSYSWYRGCGPTAGGMIIGYWDAHGFDNLIVGSNDWNTNQAAIKTMIASAGHDADYWPTPDRKPPPPLHADDSLADFMWASRDPFGQGGSYDFMQGVGLTGYASYRGYPYSTSEYSYFDELWAILVDEINADRPMELYVDRSGDGTPDHFVTVVGYDDTPGAPKYGAYNTDGLGMQWYSFDVPAAGRPYGVESGTTFLLKIGGDINLDGRVDFADYQVLEAGFGTTAGSTWGMGDFDRDGDVDFTDYQILEANFGSSVPEPGGMALLCAGTAALGFRRRKGTSVHPSR